MLDPVPLMVHCEFCAVPELPGTWVAGTGGTLPPPPNTPPDMPGNQRRVGVRTAGSYWGAGGEQIDLLSGNLNISIPIVTAQARGGWSARGFQRTFNSLHLQYFQQFGESAFRKANPNTSYGKSFGTVIPFLPPDHVKMSSVSEARR